MISSLPITLLFASRRPILNNVFSFKLSMENPILSNKGNKSFGKNTPFLISEPLVIKERESPFFLAYFTTSEKRSIGAVRRPQS